MNVERADKVQNLVYIMTETHAFENVLTKLQKIEPRTRPIKHVGARQSEIIATGYKVPADEDIVEQILSLLREIEPE